MMRTAVKKRLHFLLVALVIFGAGFQFLPETIDLNGSFSQLLPLILAVTGYFVLLPTLYWLWIIKAGQQKPWKMLISLSLSFLCARYSFPENVAEHFEFITYLRYPIIGVILLIELFLIWTIAKGLWQARKLSGDPRVHTFEKYHDDDKKLLAGLPIATEVACWYYLIPRFSRQHLPTLCRLNISPASSWNWLLNIIMTLALGVASYMLLVDWSEIAAAIVTTIILYSVFFITASYRVAKHYGMYIKENTLVVNKGLWSLMLINLDDIKEVNVGEFDKKLQPEQMALGKGGIMNVELVFSSKQKYLGMMGQFPENIDTLWLNVDHPESLTSLCTLTKETVEVFNATKLNKSEQITFEKIG